MNVSELARILRVPQELRDKLPQFGFDIGQKAIKVDDRLAQRIIKEWPFLIRRFEKEGQDSLRQKAQETEQEVVKREVKIPQIVTVKDFAAWMNVPVSKVLAELMKNGIFTSLNERIDFETAWLVGSNLDVDIKLDESLEEKKEEIEDNKLKTILGKEADNDMLARSPVVVVMGHVDHGKTRLLDAIRKTNIIAGEAGGITQHIGAYQIAKKDKTVTFIDTPGHEAFTAMRSRGAKVADIAILVVAADDGVKPQTVEAFNIIKAAKIPFVVAINKIDKEDADINRTKQELSTQLNIVSEDWGGKTVCALVSAKDGKGIEELLDMILLTADMEAASIKANPKAQAVGTIIESHLDKGEGPVATILIQNGTIRLGDQLCFNGQILGKARALKNYKGETVFSAMPSMPIKIIGLKVMPRVGDILEVGDGEKIKIRKNLARPTSAAVASAESKENENLKKLNIIIKSDVLGSAEAVEESLEKINTQEVKTNILQKGLGNITDGDIVRAETSGAQVIGFNVKILPKVEALARNKNVKVKIYNVIYHLLNDIKEEMQSLIVPELIRVDLGKLKVLGIFRTENKLQIVGGKVIEGVVEKESKIEVWRGDDFLSDGKLANLQAGKQDVNSVEMGQECGLRYEGKPVIQVGDILHFYKEEKVVKKI